jgi:glycosyltransferase involved in cell wall biosynthesis
MESLSVIVPTHNNVETVERTLRSAEAAVAFLKRQEGFHDTLAEIVVVDDGSADGTSELLDRYARGRSDLRVVHHPHPTSPSYARNAGVAAAAGALLFFLDGDDLFFPNHLYECCRALREPAFRYVKTGVRLADPVHPDWRPRIEGSLVLNLGVRRECHFAVGGFPDYHLFVRSGREFRPLLDVFYKIEDMYYNQLLGRLFAGAQVAAETVQYVRRPGNAYDRQYEKFCRPFSEGGAALTGDERLRLQLADILVEDQLGRLARRPGGG